MACWLILHLRTLPKELLAPYVMNWNLMEFLSWLWTAQAFQLNLCTSHRFHLVSFVGLFFLNKFGGCWNILLEDNREFLKNYPLGLPCTKVKLSRFSRLCKIEAISIIKWHSDNNSDSNQHFQSRKAHLGTNRLDAVTIPVFTC